LKARLKRLIKENHKKKRGMREREIREHVILKSYSGLRKKTQVPREEGKLEKKRREKKSFS